MAAHVVHPVTSSLFSQDKKLSKYWVFQASSTFVSRSEGCSSVCEPTISNSILAICCCLLSSQRTQASQQPIRKATSKMCRWKKFMHLAIFEKKQKMEMSEAGFMIHMLSICHPLLVTACHRYSLNQQELLWNLRDYQQVITKPFSHSTIDWHLHISQIGVILQIN